MSTFVRMVVVGERHPVSGVPVGVVGVAYRLLRQVDLDEDQRLQLTRCIRWFELHLPVPERFNRTTSKGHYRRQAKGISWLRDTASEHLAQLRALADEVRACGYEVVELRETRPGYVVHEDDLQVVAEPFRDTRVS